MTFDGPPCCWLSTRNLHIYARGKRTQYHLHIGVRLGISADYRTGSAPSPGKKSNTFTGHWSRQQTVQGENKVSEKSKSKTDQQSLNLKKSEINQQSCDWLFSRCLLDPHSKILMHQSIPAVPISPHPGHPQGICSRRQSRGGAFTILSRLGGWAFAHPGVTPGHLTHVSSKVPWMSSSGKTRRLSINGLSVRD